MIYKHVVSFSPKHFPVWSDAERQTDRPVYRNQKGETLKIGIGELIYTLPASL